MSKNRVLTDKNSIQINVQLVLFQEDGIWVVYCPALELSSYGDDEKEAKLAFETEMDIFLKETTKRGTLEKYLLKNGWQLQQKPKPEYHPPAISLYDSQRLLNKKNSRVFNERVNIPVA